MKTAKYWVDKLQLQKHPEGGWYKEVYRSDDVIKACSLSPDFKGSRNASTSIYYLLEKDNISAFHRIKSDEIWHYYTGTSAIEILWIQNNKLIKRKLGADIDMAEHFQVVVPKNTWFAARLLDITGYALVGCTVSPGFHFADFEMADQNLLGEFALLANEIKPLI